MDHHPDHPAFGPVTRPMSARTARHIVTTPETAHRAGLRLRAAAWLTLRGINHARHPHHAHPANVLTLHPASPDHPKGAA